ncbi:MAG TPA: PAS domain S-box protein [Verrucomicrobiales bacterium]|nr:PAS domain S-box protein [Verrucomicrobiales bacterium]
MSFLLIFASSSRAVAVMVVEGLGEWLGNWHLWKQYPRATAGIVAALLLQTGIIIGLLLQSRRRQKAEAELRSSEERYREVVESQNEMVCRYLPDTTLTFVNEAYCRFFERARDQLLGRQFLDLIPESNRPEILRRIESLLKGGRLSSHEHEVTLPDGSVGWMEWADYVIYDETGTPKECQGIGRDITARKKAEDELVQSERRFSCAFEASPSAMSINRQLDGVFLDVNPAWETLFGFKRSEVAGRSPGKIGMFDPPETMDRLEAVFYGNDFPKQCEVPLRTGHGEVRTFHLSIQAITIGTEPCYISILQDITERKRTEESLQDAAHMSRLAIMGELTATIAHEINQPLGAILTNAEAAEILLSQSSPPLKEIEHILADIRRDDVRAGQVIRRIRSLLRKKEIVLAPLDLNKVTREVLRLIAPETFRRGVAVQQELTSHPLLVQGDAIYLQQVILNLALNAMDAMDAIPMPQRRLKVSTSVRENGLAMLTVSDTGTGIPSETVPRIFESFFTTKPEGMGLGLGIARSIVEAHGGRITVGTGTEGGTHFHTFLPRHISSAV